MIDTRNLVQGLLRIVDDQRLAAIGRVISQWSIMEATLDAALCQTLGGDGTSPSAICSREPLAGKLDLLASSLTQIEPGLGQQAENLSSYVRSRLVDPRDLVAHALWIDVPGANNQRRGKPGSASDVADYRKCAEGSRMLSGAQLDALARETAEVTAWLLALCRVLPAFQPWQASIKECATRAVH